MFLFQLTTVTPTYDTGSVDFTVLLSDPAVTLIFSLVIGVFLFVVLLLLLRWFLQRQGWSHHAFDLKVLLVRVPKELRKEDIGQEKSQQQIQELIGHMETVFATVGSLKPQKSWKSWFFGRTDAFGFEMAIHEEKISFYVAVPSLLQTFIEEQIHAQYPNADISLVTDYNIFSPMGVILGSHLTFRREGFFPLKTYRKLETDSINSLTNALAKVESGDGAVIQYLVRSAYKEWRKEGIRIARAMQQGKKLEDVRKSNIWRGVWKGLRGLAKTSIEEKKAEDVYRLSPLEEEMVKGLEEKSAKAGLDVNVRIVVSAKTPEKAQRYLNDILNAYGQFNIYEYGNSFAKSMPRFQTKLIRQFIFRQFERKMSVLLNAEEAASIFHFPLPITETPKINWLLSRKALPPTNLPNEGLVLGVSEYRNQKYDIRIKPADRQRHMYIIGKSGSGKTALMASMIRQDIIEGRGVCLIDPHGDFADECLTYVPKERADDVIFFDPADYERPIGLNMLEFDSSQPQLRTFVINEMLKIFDRLYDLKATGGPMFETYMRNAILLLMDHVESGNTLMDIPRVLADEDYRNLKLSHCQSQEVKDFWQKEALKAGGESSLANMVPYITSKLASFVYNDYMRPIVGQQQSGFDLRDVMDNQKILLLKLSKGKVGDLNAYLLGMVLVGKILNAALARADMAEKDRKNFYLYIDEFQNFLTDSITAILSEARKYALNLIIAHQFIGQLVIGKTNDTTIRDAVFGNVGTMMVFRIGVEDAEFIAKEYAPVLSEYDLVNPEALTANVKLLIDNTASRPFNMKVKFAPRPGPKEKELAEMIRELSRYKYGRRRELIEAEMAERRLSVAGGDMPWDEPVA